MQITGDLVKYLEKLGRIQLTPEQENATEKDLQEILSYIETLNELNTQGVEPLSHSFPVTNVFHEDEVIPSMDRVALLANAPNQKDGCFQVPKTVE
uniref:Asp-tRNA(Asn)/Glu-tRNA(Gln) amidotransferase subunit GatC n=1 Tax=Candidatus Fimivicinus sp. TaxID=3056640 RepID=UPI003FEE13A8